MKENGNLNKKEININLTSARGKLVSKTLFIENLSDRVLCIEWSFDDSSEWSKRFFFTSNNSFNEILSPFVEENGVEQQNACNL